jgi:hypothetical protein
MWNEFRVRLGTFCVLLGLGVSILFIASDAGGHANFDSLFWSMALIIMGVLLHRRKPTAPPSGRFSSLSRLRKPRHKRREDE